MPPIRTGPIPLPADVVDYVTDAFLRANVAASSRLDRMPTMHETNLDFAFIDALAASAGPHLSPSGVIVDFEVHFVGGGRHWDGRWEVADIGLLINFRRSGALVRTKVILLQSKRLYPTDSEFVEFRSLHRLGGFGSLMEPSWLPASAPRTFTFTADCRYKALQVGDEQWAAIRSYEEHHSIPVHYLLYHPSTIPYSQEVPTRFPVAEPIASPRVGARVMSSSDLRAASTLSPRNSAPSFAELSQGSDAPGSPVQVFVRDEVLTCRQGYVADPGVSDPGLFAVFNQRGAPIAAAVRFDIDVPEDFVLPEAGDDLPF